MHMIINIGSSQLFGLLFNRYFVEKNGKPTTESLFEEWFHCTDLAVQLKPIIEK